MGISLTSTPLPRPSETKSHSAIRKKDPTATENDLQAKLQSWQKTTAKAIYSRATYRKHGPFFLISDENLDRIVVCAQMKKIKSVADIAREMCWNEANTHGAAILAIINEVYAPPVTAPPPHTGVDIDMGGSSVVVRDQIKRAPPTCSTCGTMGHTSRNRNCPGKIATTSTASVAVSPVTADVRSTPTHITFPPHPQLALTGTSFPGHFSYPAANFPHVHVTPPTGSYRSLLPTPPSGYRSLLPTPPATVLAARTQAAPGFLPYPPAYQQLYAHHNIPSQGPGNSSRSFPATSSSRLSSSTEPTTISSPSMPTPPSA